MKRITLLLLLIFSGYGSSFGQCNNETQYPNDPVPANSNGLWQTIVTCVTTQDYSVISDLVSGGDYIFTCVGNEDHVHKYITAKSTTGAVIAQGISPLSVNDVPFTDIELHFTEDAACTTNDLCATVKLFAVLPCPLPLNVQLSAISTTTASFTWAAGGDETAWEVLVLPAGEDAPTAATAGTPVTGTPAYTTTVPLTIGTAYQFYYRANCGTEYSPWGGPYDFNTECASSPTFLQNFESTEIEEVPDCWTALKIGADEYANASTVSYMTYQSNRSFELYNAESPSTAQIMLVSPPLSTMATGTHRVKFYGAAYDEVQVEVGTINSPTPTGVFTLKETITLTEDYAEFVVDFSDYTGTDNYLVFRHANTDAYQSFFLDNIRWEISPLCPDVSEIIVQLATTVSATIGWAPSGTETEWDVVYGGESVTDPTTLTPVIPSPTGTPVATITGLNPDTVYNVWVRSVCGGPDGDGAWIGPVTFRTACLPVALINEDFDDTDEGGLPNCWSALLSGEGISEYAFIEVSEDEGVEESNAVRLNNNDSEPDANVILVSPHLDNLSAGTHRLKFYAKVEGEGSLEIGTVNTAAQGAIFTLLETIELDEVYSEYTVDFTGYTGTNTFIAFRHVTPDFYTNIYVDNVRWEVAPLCADVTDVEIHSVTTTTAGVFWVANASETEWDVVYGEASVTDPTTLIPISPAPTVSPGATLSSLTPNTVYKVWVRSACGGTIGDGAWIGPVRFRTACLPVGEFTEDFDATETGDLPDCWTAVIAGETVSQDAYVNVINYQSTSGENSVELYASESGDDDNIILVSPNLNTLAAGTHRIKFKAFAYDGGSIQVGTLNGNTASAVFTPIADLNVSDNFEEYAVNFTDYTGTDTYVGIRNTSGIWSSVYIDDVKWELAPLCPDVTGIAVTQITTGGAAIDWMSGGDEGGWQVVYGPASAIDPTTLTPSPVLSAIGYPLTGLADDTEYKVWVRSVCGGAEGDGAWIGPKTFRTLCTPGTLPYTEDFESAVTPLLPGCTLQQNVGGGNNWEVEEAPGTGFTNNTLVYTYHGDYNADVWFYTRGLPLTAGTEYTISYKYGDNGNDDYSEKLEVKYGLSPDASAMTLPLADHPEINSDTPAVNQVSFTPAVTGTYYFGFHAYSESYQYYLYVDDIVIDSALGTVGAQQSTFTYYPNPVKDVLKLSYSSTISNVMVYNLLGQMVLNADINSNTADVDMSRLPAGNYIVKVSADNLNKTIKIIKD